MPTINSQFRDFLLKHSHYVYSFENGTINSIVEPYQNAKSEIIKRVSDLEDYGQGWTLQYRMDRLNARLNEVDMVLKNATQDSIANLSNNLNEFAMSEKDYVETLLSNPFGQIGINTVRLPYEQIYEIVNTPIGGEMYHERMVQRYGESMRAIKANLTQSVIQGEDMAKAARNLFGIGKGMGGVVGNRLAQQSAVLARTEIMRVSNAVSERIYNENKDVLKGTEWIATLDNRTCLLPFSLVYTKKGWKAICEVEVGDLIFTHNMEWKRVLGKTRQVKSEYLKIKLSNGKELCITPDHRVLVNGEWVEIGGLEVGSFIDGSDI